MSANPNVGESEVEAAKVAAEETSSDVEEEDEDLDIDSEGDYEVTLDEVVVVYDEIKKMLTAEEEKLSPESPSKPLIYAVKAAAARLHGDIDDLQCDLDELTLSNEEERAIRKKIIDELSGVYDRVYALDDKCVELLKSAAESEKKLGNDLFKQGNYTAAVEHYSSAIAIDATNPPFYTNRALAYQKLGLFANAIDDAQQAVDLDVNFLKGYVILTKCYIATDNVIGCTETIASIPNSFQEQKDVLELKALTAAAAKDNGNKFFKEKKIDDAIRFYTMAINCTPENHLYYSNRSAAYQTKSMWSEALKDAEKCVHVCETFPKGYLHMARCQLQLKSYADAESTVNMAMTVLEDTAELESITPQLNEILAGVRRGKGATQSSSVHMSDSAKAEQFKQRGNAYYKSEEYQEAVRFYTQAISLCPTEGAYYGNRSAAWLMMKEYKRAVTDCVEGIKYETTPGQLDKLRQRHASALAANGAFEEAVAVLEEALSLEGRENANMVPTLEAQLEKLRQAGVHVEGGAASLEKGEYSRAKRLFQNAQSCGMSDAPVVLLGLGKACLGLEDFEEASRCAQKVIVAGGQVSIDAYTIRADALQATGCTELAQKHLMAALQLDPDNSTLQQRLKALRRTVSETNRVRDQIDKAMNARKYDEAVRHCGEGLQIDRNVKKLMAEFHSRRAKAYSMLAKLQLRGGHAAAATASTAGAKEGTAADDSDPQSMAQGSYRRCLQDANASIYYDGSETSLPAIFLKCEALQALDRHQEALDTLEECYKNGPGEGDRTVREKHKEAQRLLKKSLRVDYYKLLGCIHGEHSSEKEIKTCYRKAALKWHPDRHSAASDEKKKEAEAKFKEIGDAYELLTDPQRKALYDQGYDREEIEQQMEMRNQQSSHGGYGGFGGGGGRRGHHGGGFGGFGGHGGFGF